MKNLKQLTMLIILPLFLTGCWDEIEIEQRAFVYGVAVDLAEQETSSDKKIELTSQLIVPEAFSSASGGGGSGPAYRNLSQTGESIVNVNREMVKQASRSIDVTHLSIVLFSEELANQPYLLSQSIDIFLREKDMRRGILIAITNGKAKEFLSIEPPQEKIPAEYLNKLISNKGNLEIISTIRLGDIQEKVLQKLSFPLPLLKIENPTSVKYDGIALINGQRNQMVGSLKGDSAKALSFLIEDKHTGTINIEVEGETSTIEILKIKREISLENEDPNNLKFLFTIDVVGTIAEQIGHLDVMNPEVHEKFENELKKRIEELTTVTVERLQKDFQTDVLELGVFLYHHKPKLWSQIEENWEKGDNKFSKSNINFKINTTIERPGSMNRTSSDGGGNK